MDILSVDEGETFLGIQSGEGGTFLTTCIADVSRMLAVVTGRFDWGPSAERTEYHDGGRSWVALNYWPVTASAVYDDVDHVWGSDTLEDSTGYYIDELGVLHLESGKFSAGHRNLKIVYTAGYANEAAVPAMVKTWAKRQLERTWNSRKRSGQNIKAGDSEVMPEVREGLSQYTRKIPFV